MAGTKGTVETVDLSKETLEKQNTLTQDQIDALAQEALADIEKKPKEGEEELKSEEESGQPEIELSPEEKEKKEKEEQDKIVKEEADAAQKEEQRLLNAKDEELNADDKTKRAELIKLKDEDKQKQLTLEIETYARENSITVDDAKKEIEEISKVEEKYGKDSRKIAKANLNLQKMYTKAQEEMKAQREQFAIAQANVTIENVISDVIDKGLIKVNGKTATREMVIEEYRKQEPKLTENLDDESVLKLGANHIKTQFENKRSQAQVDLSIKAKDKRLNVLNILPESDKKYIPDIKPIVDKLNDQQVMSDAFSVNDLVLWAKGKNSDKDIKDAEERGYQRGLSSAKILGRKSETSPKGNPAPSKTKGAPTLLDEDKQRAEEMYEGLEMTTEEKYIAYAETMAIGAKKK